MGPTTTQREEFNLPLISGHLKALGPGLLIPSYPPSRKPAWMGSQSRHGSSASSRLLNYFLVRIPTFLQNLETS